MKKLMISLQAVKGWSKKVENKDPKKCDSCGSKLWIGPGNINNYCEAVHSRKEVARRIKLSKDWGNSVDK